MRKESVQEHLQGTHKKDLCAYRREMEKEKQSCLVELCAGWAAAATQLLVLHVSEPHLLITCISWFPNLLIPCRAGYSDNREKREEI